MFKWLKKKLSSFVGYPTLIKDTETETIWESCCGEMFIFLNKKTNEVWVERK